MGEDELEGNQIIDGRGEEDLPPIIFHYAIFINQGKNEGKNDSIFDPKTNHCHFDDGKWFDTIIHFVSNDIFMFSRLVIFFFFW